MFPYYVDRMARKILPKISATETLLRRTTSLVTLVLQRVKKVTGTTSRKQLSRFFLSDNDKFIEDFQHITHMFS